MCPDYPRAMAANARADGNAHDFTGSPNAGLVTFVPVDGSGAGTSLPWEGALGAVVVADVAAAPDRDRGRVPGQVLALAGDRWLDTAGQNLPAAMSARLTRVTTQVTVTVDRAGPARRPSSAGCRYWR